MQQAGPTVGLNALRSQFPDLARSQLADLQRQSRQLWFHDHEIFADTLEWIVPGSVWATDFSESPVPIDGDFRHVLAVRDLASHRQLLLMPAQYADAATALAAMEHLFATCGLPLVLKSDNGSPFIADIFTKLLLRWGVTSLLSPPHWPPYNGSIEAGFGASKTRIHIEAVRHGRFNHWLLDDVEAARQLANCASRPWGVLGPTPQQRWDRRTPITPQQRQTFQNAVLNHQRIVRLELGVGPEQELKRKVKAMVARESIGRALVGLGYLQVQRRRITPPFNLSFGAIIT